EYNDGRRVEFRVYQRTEHGKDVFPTATVYANTDSPELRLITCGGPFDRSSRRYTNNVIIWARAE
ncbi:MAG: class F sortase, partial [Actinomycetota bacterium]|nr:class F sortase [Actinomycetota bacterium]